MFASQGSGSARAPLPVRAMVLSWGLLASACSRCDSLGHGGASAFRITPSIAPLSAEESQAAASKISVSERLVIDQFGYRPDLPKVAVLPQPVRGFAQGAPYTAGKQLEVRRWQSAELVFTGAPKVWNEGAIDALSGDRGAWFDFSALTEPGDYYLYDPAARVRSHRFRVADDVYRGVLKAAMRMFYFNRANQAKVRPHACVGKKCWLQGASYLGPGQDRSARSVRARNDDETRRDLSGGWWDAGDVNKYVTFAETPVHQLLSAYGANPAAFGDDFDLPESNNGLPDLVDELRVELDWLERMQPPDLGGGLLLKVGNVDFGEPLPEQSRVPRYYYPEPCSAATIAGAGMFAHAAWALRDIATLKGYSAELGARARRAFDFYLSHPRREDCDDGTIKSGDADRTLLQQERASVVAAVYLFALTGESQFEKLIEEKYGQTRPFQDDRWSVYEPEQGDALLAYTRLPAANPALKAAILQRKSQQAREVEIYGLRPELDLYRAYMRRDSYHWGSNQPRANYGNTNYDLLDYALVPETTAGDIRARAAGLLHFFHGVNPLALVYLSQMEPYGAEKSVSELFHSWFRDGDPRWDSSRNSSLGPAPGYVVGGPNANYCTGDASAGARCRSSELVSQPIGKRYADFNTGWAPKKQYDRSWELSEPAIYYQAAYVRLLSRFVGAR